jgi:toxin CptA
MASVRSAFKYSGGRPPGDPAWRVDIVLGASRRLEAWVTAVAAASLMAGLLANLPGVARAALACVLAIAAVRAARREAFREGAGAVRRMSVDLAGRVEVEGADGRVRAGRLTDDSFVAPWLTVVRWRPDGARFSRAIVIVPDAVEPGPFRRLRILLRWR